MKKFMLKNVLVLSVPLLILAGCGGGGSGSLSDNGGDTGGLPGGGGNAASLTNVTVNFPPADVSRGLIDANAVFISRNAGRVVATHTVQENTTCKTYEDPRVFNCFDIDGNWFTDPDGQRTEYYSYASNPDTDLLSDEDCVEITGCAEWNTDDVQIVEAVGDGTLDENGGSVSIAVPPGTLYTIHVLTYKTGLFYADSDTFVKTIGDIPLLNNRIDMSNTARRNLMLEYGKSASNIEIKAGENTTLDADTDITWETDTGPLAQLQLPTTPILAGDSYDVSVVSCLYDPPHTCSTKSSALRDTWYVMREDNNDTANADLMDTWFINEPGVDVSSSETKDFVTLSTKADDVTGKGGGDLDPAHEYWHFAQFFISRDLLVSGEDYRDWTFGTSLPLPLNAWGGVIFE